MIVLRLEALEPVEARERLLLRRAVVPALPRQLVHVHQRVAHEDDLVVAAEVFEHPLRRHRVAAVHPRVGVERGVDAVVEVVDVQLLELVGALRRLKEHRTQHKDMNIQAGEYELTKSMTPEEMLRKFENGDVKIHTKTVTLVEGKRLEDYATTLSQTFNFTKKDFMDVVDDPEYINELIDQYWFLTDDVLQEGIYHPLEGYLYPDTYEFLETSNEKDIIERLLSHMGEKLSTYQSEIEQSSYSVHELLTLASIVEKETTREEDRAQAA